MEMEPSLSERYSSGQRSMPILFRHLSPHKFLCLEPGIRVGVISSLDQTQTCRWEVDFSGFSFEKCIFKPARDQQTFRHGPGVRETLQSAQHRSDQQ